MPKLSIIAKHSILQLLRATRLLGLADHAFFFLDRLKNRGKNRQFINCHPDFPLPPYELAFDAYGSTDWNAYYEQGNAFAQLIGGQLSKHIKGKSADICEWGCGPARILRHMQTHMSGKNVSLYGCDYNAKTIAWCKGALQNIDFKVNNLEPPLPYAASAFGGIFSVSVFTHLSEEMHHAWIRELHRILKPGGILLITTHGKNASSRLLASEKELFDRGALVVRARMQEGKKWFLAYHPDEFIRGKLLTDFDVLENGRFASTQDYWVAKKKR